MEQTIKLMMLTLKDMEQIGADGRGQVPRNEAAELIPDVVVQSAIERSRQGEDWFWCAPRLFYHSTLAQAVGSGCFKNSPAQGRVEIGYGVADIHAGKGFATAAMALLVQEAFSRPAVNEVAAETAVANIASGRVLEKNGFRRIAQRFDAADGLLNQWIKLRRD